GVVAYIEAQADLVFRFRVRREIDDRPAPAARNAALIGASEGRFARDRVAVSLAAGEQCSAVGVVDEVARCNELPGTAVYADLQVAAVPACFGRHPVIEGHAQ